jgi:DNA-binding beta-propeller fold protein YncE
MWRLVALITTWMLFTCCVSISLFAAGPYTVVLDRLQSPRGLSFGPGGLLYVAQAGSGGLSGKVIEIRHPSAVAPNSRDVLTGLISVGGDGEFVGADGISVLGNGGIYVIMALSNRALGFTSQLGHLLKISQAGEIRDVANVGDFDFDWTNLYPDLAPHDFPDANPYAVLALPDRVYVADAGANTLNVVRLNGSDEILAFFPNNVLADSTPTCIAQGPDGALYIGTLALIDSAVFGPSAVVYRVDPNATDPNNLGTVLNIATPWATGLWPINGCAFAPDGSFYASQLFTNSQFGGGDVIKIPFATPDVHASLTSGALIFPAGVAVGEDGNVYVSNGSAFVPEGQVLRLTAH